MPKTYECLKSVFAPKVGADGSVIRSFPYAPGDEIIFDDADPTANKEVHAQELVDSGHIGKKGSYKKIVAQQKKDDASGLTITEARTELAKARAENQSLREEIDRLTDQVSKSKTRI